jgi:DNA-binding NtrC family response regulator
MILLIDDSDNERALIRKMLESAGHQVREAPDGDAGIAAFSEVGPALVLCDLMMPVKDGFATVEEMQKLVPDAKIIAMSGVWFGKTDHNQMARDLGLLAVIEKPFERQQLLRLVEKALRPPARPKRKPKPKAKAKTKPKAKPRRKAVSKRKTKAATKRRR